MAFEITFVCGFTILRSHLWGGYLWIAWPCPRQYTWHPGPGKGARNPASRCSPPPFLLGRARPRTKRGPASAICMILLLVFIPESLLFCGRHILARKLACSINLLLSRLPTSHITKLGGRITELWFDRSVRVTVKPRGGSTPLFLKFHSYLKNSWRRTGRWKRYVNPTFRFGDIASQSLRFTCNYIAIWNFKLLFSKSRTWGLAQFFLVLISKNVKRLVGLTYRFHLLVRLQELFNINKMQHQKGGADPPPPLAIY